MKRKFSVSHKVRRSSNRMSLNKKKPSNFWAAFFAGMANIWPSSPRDYIHPTGGGFSADAKAMRSDFAVVAGNMRRVLKTHEQTDSN